MNLADFLPQPFWIGPPLPKFLNIRWPWASEGSLLPSLPQLPSLPWESIESVYENEEIIEWLDWRGRERKVKITRKARRQ